MLGYRVKETVDDSDAGDRNLITIWFYMSRRHTFYLVSIALPVFFLILTSCTVFVIPADAGEKLGMAITVLLTFAVYLTIVTSYLPETSLQVHIHLTFLCRVSFILTTSFTL